MLYKNYYVYILASRRNGTLYIGVTNNLERRVYEHKNNLIKGFTKKYNVKRLVYYENYNDVYIAISREKQMKKWKRAWKLKIIERENPSWKDISQEWDELLSISPPEFIPCFGHGTGMTQFSSK